MKKNELCSSMKFITQNPLFINQNLVNIIQFVPDMADNEISCSLACSLKGTLANCSSCIIFLLKIMLALII